jgi:3-oxoacyl-[acyl-carrier-protein] synthase II
LFDTSGFKVNLGGEISDFRPKEIFDKKKIIDFDRSTTLLLASAQSALEDAQLEMREQNTKETGIAIGTTFGSLNSLSEFDRASVTDGPHFVNASRFPNTVVNSPASRLAIWYGIKGLNATLSTGFCAALDAVDYALHCINSQRAERMIVGTVEEMCIQTFLGFHKLNYLSGTNNSPHVLSCPFDKRRNGILFSEGSACFILEKLDSALERQADIYGEILGVGSVFEPYRLHKYHPQGKGMISAMALALKNAQLHPKEIDCIFAHANSTVDADLIETKAIKEVFGKSGKNIAVTAVKSMLGETFSACGAMALAAGLGSIIKDFIPPTINYSHKDPDCDLDCVPNKARKQKINTVMINSFDPNGGNTALIVGKYKGTKS